ncbi:MAG: ABC transporter permease [Oscillospiraceae bacterium]|jgi:ribose transport system permease protein
MDNELNVQKKSFGERAGDFIGKPVVRGILPFVGLIVITILLDFLTGGKLIQTSSIKLMLSQVYVLMIASTGVFMIMTMGCLDFSQGSMLGIASIVVCVLSFYSIPLAILGGMVTGAAIGAVNAFFHVKRKIPSFIVTICTMYLFRGLCSYFASKKPVAAVANISQYNTLGIKLGITVAVLAVAWFIFTFTKVGTNLKSIGAGETASRFAGIKVEKTKWIVYIIAGAITGLAAFVNIVKVGSVTPSGGSMLETQILIALVLGGMPVSGGPMVRFSNVVCGVLTFKILASGLQMLGLATERSQLIEGIVFLIVVALFSDRRSLRVIK